MESITGGVLSWGKVPHCPGNWLLVGFYFTVCSHAPIKLLLAKLFSGL